MWGRRVCVQVVCCMDVWEAGGMLGGMVWRGVVRQQVWLGVGCGGVRGPYVWCCVVMGIVAG